MQPPRSQKPSRVFISSTSAPPRTDRPFRPRPALETLEGRRLFSYTVNETYPGFFEVQADNSGNVISASVNQNDMTFTLDGNTYSNVSYIYVIAGNGNDDISIQSVDGSGMIGAAVTSGGGDDTITVNFDGAIWAGNGKDTLHLSDSFRGEAYGDAGADRIIISGACINAEIQGGDGNDLIDCTSNDSNVVIHGGAGNDTLYGSAYDDVLYGDDGQNVYYGMGGNDVFYAHAGDTVDGGGGSDTLHASGSVDSVMNIEVIIT